ELQLGSGREARALQLELAWRVEIVGVEKRQQIAPCDARPVIARRRYASVRLVHQAHRFAEGPGDLDRTIGRSVVDDDDLERWARLRENARDRLGQIALAVEDRDD